MVELRAVNSAVIGSSPVNSAKIKSMIEIDEEKYDKLPFRESRFQNLTRRFGSMYNCTKFEYRYDPFYKIVNRILRNNIGKPFDVAFSYFCRNYPQYKWKQYYFLEKFEGTWSEYSIDDNGNICYESRYRKSDPHICITSEDYRTEERHKITGHKKSDFKAIFKDGKTRGYDYYYYSEVLYYLYGCNDHSQLPRWQVYKAVRSDFENVIVSGSIQWFESKNDPRYQRHQAESRKKRRKNRRINRKLAEQRDWESSLRDGKIALIEFKRKQQEKIRREEQLNVQTIERLGFDPITSFRTHRT